MSAIQFDSTTSLSSIPKICLNMIVKNESRVICRLLESVVPLIDGYCICDTGSTDDTVEKIVEFFKQRNIEGQIIREPFRDFGYNRTFALKACETMPAPMDYILLMDADMVLTGDYLRHTEDFKRRLTADCYHVCQGTPAYYYKNVRLVKNCRGFSYWGVTHEYVQSPTDCTYEAIDNANLFIQDIGDGGSKQDKFERDIRLLTKGLHENPNNDRYTFYLGNSYKDAGHYEKAIETYKKRIEIGGWIEEVWHSHYNIGHCYRLLDQPEKAVYAWLHAFEAHPKRIESLYEIIHHYRMRGKNRLAYLYYVAAAQSRTKWGASSDYLFLQKDVYDYKIDYELSIIGYYINTENYNLNNICMKVLTYPYSDDFIAKNVLSNYKFYCNPLTNAKRPIQDQHRKTLENATKSLNITETGEFVASTPSICIRGNTLIVNVRYVNYKIDAVGHYINQEQICTRNAVALIDISKDIWRITQEFELDYDHTLNSHYVGLEDVRIFEWNNKIWYNSNRGIGFQCMKIEHGEIDFAKERTVNSRCLEKTGETAIEKNWVLFSNNKKQLKAIYNWSPLIIGDIHDAKFMETNTVDTPYFFKYLRGSTNGVIIQNEFRQNEIWFICHAVSYEDRRYYYHILVVLDSETYQVKRYSPFFTFEGEKVEYTLGFVYSETKSEFLIGYSVYDNTTKYMNISRDYVESCMIQHER